MACKVMWTKSARDDVDRAVRYVAVDLDSPKAAGQLLDALESAVEEIGVFPEACAIHRHPALASRSLRAKFVKRHVILYSYDDNEVLVFRVFHTLQDYAKIIARS